MKKRYWLVGLGSFVVTLALFLTLLFPLWDKRFNVFDLAGKDEDPLGPLEVYGVMPAAVTDSWEWNGNVGRSPDMVRLGTSQYYLIINSAVGTDGWLQTIRVWNDNGTIQKSNVSTYEFDTSYCEVTGPAICHVSGNGDASGDIYAGVYQTGDPVGRVFTVRVWHTNGTIKPTKIDTQSLATYGFYYDIVALTQNMVIVAYQDQVSKDGFIASLYINSAGVISGVNETLEFNTSDARVPKMTIVDSNTIAIVYDGNVVGDYDGYVVTYNISTVTGDITNAWADQWEFDTTSGQYPDIKKVSGNVYAIAYRDTNADIQIKTLTIAPTGMITKSWIDTLVMGAETAVYPTLFCVNDADVSADGNGVYGVTYQWTDADGVIKTFNLSSDGTIGAAIIDNLEFDAADCVYWAPIQYVNQSWYYIAYTGTGNDGWSCTVNILTNWASPVFSNEVPENSTVGVSLSPKCNITINDTNADSMTLTWQENSTGSWVTRQVNSTCTNNTYRWVFDEASSYDTMYWWRVYCNDSMHNVSEYYYFTTRSPPTPASISLGGLTDDWNVTFDGDVPVPPGPEIVFCTSSGIEEETVEINIVVGEVDWVDEILFWASWLNDTINNTQIYTDNITVWVSDDNITWGILQDDVGSGMGRFPHTGGYLTWNFSTNPAGVDPFTYYPGYGYRLADDVTLYALYQLNITTTAKGGLHHNLSGSPWDISISNNSDILDSASHTVQAEIRGGAGRTTWVQAWTSNMSFSNGSGLRYTQSWYSNMSFSNSTTGFVQSWTSNMSFSNGSGLSYVQGWYSNMSFSNGTVGFVQSWFSNMSFSNGSGLSYVQGWYSNMSFSNGTVGFVQSWFSNMSFSNSTTGFTQGWYSNMSFSNGSGLRPVQVWTSNMSFSNSSLSYVSVWASNMSFSNTTVFKQVWSSNMSFSNTTIGFVQGWYSNMSFSNTTIFAQSWISNMSFSNSTFVFGQSWYSNMSFSNGSGLRPVQAWTSNMSFSNSSPSATPFNINLYVHNPNPGNGTHSTNYLKRDSAGLTTSVDVVYQNFTTPGALIPGDYSLEFDSLHYSGPSIENNSGVYMNVNLNTTGRVISGHEWVGQSESGGDYFIQRSYLIFNTTSLVDTAVVNSAYISMVVYQDYSDTDFNVSLQQVRAPAPHNPMIPGDYHRNCFVGEYNTRNTSGYVAEDWFNFSLPPAAFADIDATGHTYFGLRSDQDIAQSAPGVGVDEWIGFYGPGGVAPWKAPHLIVNYTVPGSNWQHIVNLSWVSNSSGPWVEYNVSYVTGNETVTVFNSNFSDVDTYYWYVSWESNSTNVGFSDTFEFETVTSGGGGFIVVNIESRMALGLVVGIMFAVPFVVLFRRRKRDEHE